MPGLDMEGLTLETFDLAKAATSGMFTSTGFTGYDLAPWVNLQPVVTPFRNSLARVKSNDGNTFCTWRALLNLNAQQPNAVTPFDWAGSLIKTQEQDMLAPYSVMALADRVTQDSVDTALGLGVDPRAVARLQTLNNLYISEDKIAIGGQRYAAQTPVLGIPTTATTGGTIASGVAVHVKVAARTGENYYYGGSTVASADVTVSTAGGGAFNTVTATITSGRKGAVAFDWYVGSTNGNQQYYTTTVTPTVLITAVPTTPNAIPTNLPLLCATAAAAPTIPPVADTSADPNAMNGLIASILGDYSASGAYVTIGTGTSWGAAYTDLAGAQLTLAGGTVAEIDAMFTKIWNNVFLSPSCIMMNAIEAKDIASLTLGSPGAVTFLGIDPAAATNREDVTVGGFVGWIVNSAAGGKRVRIEVHPHVPPGTMIFRTDTVPFPMSNIGSVLQMRTLRDYSSYDYASSLVAGTLGGGPREDFEIRCVEAFTNRAPTVHGVISGVQSASAGTGA